MSMQILNSQTGERRGPYSLEEVKSLLKEGELARNDLAWMSGINAWVPLSSLPGVDQPAPAAGELPPAPSPASPPGSSSESRAASDPKPEPQSHISDFAQRRVYGAMAQWSAAALDQFLKHLHRALSSDHPWDGGAREEFFKKFLLDADRFSHRLCLDFAGLVKEASFREEVRASEVSTIAKRFRETSFSELDHVLTALIHILQESEVDLKLVTAKLQTCPLGLEASKEVHPPPTGSSAGARSEESSRASGPQSEMQKKLAMIHEQHELRVQGQALAYAKIVDYLLELRRLPEKLMDYGSVKCFGGEADYNMQSELTAKVRIGLESQLTEVSSLILNTASAERKQLERLKAKEMAKIKADEEMRAIRAHYEAQGIACMAITGVCLFPAWLVMLSGSPSEILKWFARITGVIGVLAFCWGMMRLTLNRGIQPAFLEASEIMMHPEKKEESGGAKAGPGEGSKSESS